MQIGIVWSLTDVVPSVLNSQPWPTVHAIFSYFGWGNVFFSSLVSCRGLYSTREIFPILVVGMSFFSVWCRVVDDTAIAFEPGPAIKYPSSSVLL